MGLAELQSPVRAYNRVAIFYNSVDLEKQGPLMQTMGCSYVYAALFQMQSHCRGRLLLLVLLLSPLTSLFVSLLLCYSVVNYTKQRSIFVLNQAHVQDPFKGLVFNDEVCRRMDRSVVWIPSSEQCPELTVNQDTLQKGGFWVYGSQMLEGYSNFKGYFVGHLLWAVTGLMTTAAIITVFAVACAV